MVCAVDLPKVSDDTAAKVDGKDDTSKSPDLNRVKEIAEYLEHRDRANGKKPE